MSAGNRGHESVLAYTCILIDVFTALTSTYRNTDLAWGGVLAQTSVVRR